MVPSKREKEEKEVGGTSKPRRYVICNTSFPMALPKTAAKATEEWAMLAISGSLLAASKEVGFRFRALVEHRHLPREQLGKQSMGTHSNPAVGSRQFSQISQEPKGLGKCEGWLVQVRDS